MFAVVSSALFESLKGNTTMLSRTLLGGIFASLLAAGALSFAATAAEAAMAPAPASAVVASDVQDVGCLLGAHVGPVGACVGGYRHHCWINRWGHRVCN
jgi:hypothetical protein